MIDVIELANFWLSEYTVLCDSNPEYALKCQETAKALRAASAGDAALALDRELFHDACDRAMRILNEAFNESNQNYNDSLDCLQRQSTDK